MTSGCASRRCDLPLVAYVVLAAACAPAQPGAAAPPRKLDCVGGVGLLERGWACAVRPSATGAGISDAFGLHVVAFPARVADDTPVYVHLVGTGGVPAGPAGDYTNVRVLAEGTAAGYVVINLAYANDDALLRLCRDDLDCYGPVRWEIVTGADAPPPWSSLKEVRPPDDIDSRLRALAATLVASGRELPRALRPVDWSRLRVGGHSQGGGHAALIARRREVARVCMLAAPPDASSARAPASWIGGEWATPVARRRLVVHRDDPLYPAVAANAARMGLRAEAELRVLDGPSANPHGAPVAEEGAAALRWACFE